MLALLRAKLVEWGRMAGLWLRTRRAALRASTRARRAAIASAALLLLLALLPWTLTTPGTFVVYPNTSHLVVSPDSGVIEDVTAAEGARVAAGAPLLRIANRDLDAQLLAASRAVDSLSAAESAARASGRAAEAEFVALARGAALAGLDALEARERQLTLRAIAAGEIVTPRPEQLIGRRVLPGDSLIQVATVDSVDVRITLTGAGATSIRSGQMVHLISFADPSKPIVARVAGLAATGGSAGPSRGTIEARVRLAATPAWRVGVRGEAKVDLRRSIVIGAVIWNVRQVVRGDFWL
jgi:multidrug resistance efflux pump